MGGKLGVRGGDGINKNRSGDAVGLVIDTSGARSGSKSKLIVDKGGLMLEVTGGSIREGKNKSFISGGMATGLKLVTEDGENISVWR